MAATSHIFRLIDIIATNEPSLEDEEYEACCGRQTDSNQFILQLFGRSPQGHTYAVKVEGHFPFFFLLVDESWREDTTSRFLTYLRKRLGTFYKNGIIGSELVHRKKLYGFDEGRLYPFLRLEFKNITVFNKVKRFWYATNDVEQEEDAVAAAAAEPDPKRLSLHSKQAANASKDPAANRYNSRLLKDGLVFEGRYTTQLYEAQIPPLLRFLHIYNVSPSGFVRLDGNPATIRQVKKKGKLTNATYEFIVHCTNIFPVQMEECVPFKIMSFDIEASSSHGDFPVPVKAYKKFATNVYDYLNNEALSILSDPDPSGLVLYLRNLVCMAFGFSHIFAQVHPPIPVEVVYPKLIDRMHWKKLDASYIEATRANLLRMCDEWLSMEIGAQYQLENETYLTTQIEDMFLQIGQAHAGGGSHRDGVAAAAANAAADATDAEEDAAESESASETDLDADADVDEDAAPAAENEVEQINLTQRKVDAAKTRARQQRSKTTSAATIVDVLRDIHKQFDRETIINELNLSLSKCLPQLEGDRVTFIGSTFTTYGDKTPPYKNHCIVLNTCAAVPVDNAEIEVYHSEREVLLAWQALVQREDPDIVIGYNIFGFDYEFLFRRAEENDCLPEFLKFSRNVAEQSAKVQYGTQKLSLEELSIQIASGIHELKFIPMTGRVQIDLYNYFRREVVTLGSYKLDSVAGHFIGDEVKKCVEGGDADSTEFHSGNLQGLSPGCFVHFEVIGFSIDYFADGAKFRVRHVSEEAKTFVVDGRRSFALHAVLAAAKSKVRWCLAKDDVTPKDIFRLTNGSAEDRAIVAKYCIQDCNLVHHLFRKTDILTGLIEMGNICYVPINPLVQRGQGYKLTSFVANKCREMNTLLPVLDKVESDDGYEGAFVLPPKEKIYLDDAVACLDFSSLYPSIIISENFSHNTLVWTMVYDLQGRLLKTTGDVAYDNLPGVSYVNVTYDTYIYLRKTKTSKAVKTVVGYKVCRYVQPKVLPDGTVMFEGILPAILREILKLRKITKKLVPVQTTPFMQGVMRQRELGYKKTANSLYGNCGARTSAFYAKDIAACTTATGRKLLLFALRTVEGCYHNQLCPTLRHGEVLTNAEYIYGDTDSVFFSFNLRNPATGERIVGKDALEITIELAQQAGRLATAFLKQPHDLEYEKTFQPFILLSRKKYVGMLYEQDIHKGKRKDAGNVSQRRDNAPIVKDIFGGCVETILKEKKLPLALAFLETSLQKVVSGELPIDKFVVSKSLRSGYKKPHTIPQLVLANRMGARDSGNKPAPGDRIPYVHIVVPPPAATPKAKVLQGDRIETPAYVLANPQIKIDYSFYITNQIMKPLQQLFALELEAIWAIFEDQGKKKVKVAAKKRKYESDVALLRTKYGSDETKFLDKVKELRRKEVKLLLFDDFIQSNKPPKNQGQNIKRHFPAIESAAAASSSSAILAFSKKSKSSAKFT
jgi:DNA polymerase elongation subunit (family B)